MNASSLRGDVSSPGGDASPPSEDAQLFDSLKKDKGKQYSRACVSFCFPVLSC